VACRADLVQADRRPALAWSHIMANLILVVRRVGVSYVFSSKLLCPTSLPLPLSNFCLPALIWMPLLRCAGWTQSLTVRRGALGSCVGDGAWPNLSGCLTNPSGARPTPPNGARPTPPILFGCPPHPCRVPDHPRPTFLSARPTPPSLLCVLPAQPHQSFALDPDRDHLYWYTNLCSPHYRYQPTENIMACLRGELLPRAITHAATCGTTNNLIEQGLPL
jgi:hypothetical protein